MAEQRGDTLGEVKIPLPHRLSFVPRYMYVGPIKGRFYRVFYVCQASGTVSKETGGVVKWEQCVLFL